VKTLSMLSPGDRVWVNVLGEGYVGVGEVTKPVVRIDQFIVPGAEGRQIPITEVAHNDYQHFNYVRPWLRIERPNQVPDENGIPGASAI
jgi:hypothetical protein